jgi:hypothetical protein
MSVKVGEFMTALVKTRQIVRTLVSSPGRFRGKTEILVKRRTAKIKSSYDSEPPESLLSQL